MSRCSTSTDRRTFGGQTCDEANDLYHARRHQYENADNSYLEGERDLEKLVEQYNAKLPAQQAASWLDRPRATRPSLRASAVRASASGVASAANAWA